MSYLTGRSVLRVCAAGRRVSIVVATALVVWPIAADAQSLPAGWTYANVGLPKSLGSATGSGSTFTVNGSGTEIGGTADQFTFVYRQVSGDVDVIARVASQQTSSLWSKAGVMVRASLGSSAAHNVMYVKAAGQLAFRARPVTGYSTRHTDAGAGSAPVWVKLERRGTAVTAFRSTDGVTWKMIGSQTLSLPATFYVGIVTTAGSKTGKATAQFTNVTVRAPGAAVNTPPTVSLWSPTDGATFTAPTVVNLAATANDADNGVAQVEFYANNTLVGTDTASPYTHAWTPAAGTYSVKAVARDTAGALATSAARSVTVNGVTTNTPPTVSLTAPAAGSTYTAPASVAIAANAADSNGTVARVDFYAGSMLIGSDATSPYSVTWSNAPAGSFSLTAVARDNAGATTRSAALGITIGNPALPKRAVFIASPDHATVTGYLLDVFTAGANPATAQPISTQNLGKPTVVNGECDVDISATIIGLPGGNYFATVVAVSTGGTSTRSISPTFAR